MTLRAQSIYTAFIQLKLGHASEYHQAQNQPGDYCRHHRNRRIHGNIEHYNVLRREFPTDASPYL